MKRNGSDVLYSSTTLFVVMEFNDTVSISDHPERPGGISIKNTELTEVSKRWLELQGYDVVKRELELKTCPVCGNKAVLRKFVNEYKKDYWVICDKCKIRTVNRRSEAKAIEAWNILPRREK